MIFIDQSATKFFSINGQRVNSREYSGYSLNTEAGVSLELSSSVNPAFVTWEVRQTKPVDFVMALAAESLAYNYPRYPNELDELFARRLVEMFGVGIVLGNLYNSIQVGVTRDDVVWVNTREGCQVIEPNIPFKFDEGQIRSSLSR